MAAYLRPARYPLPECKRTHGFRDTHLADFIEEDRYFTDPAVDVSHEAAVYMLSRGAGPIYARRSGKRVWFDDLEWDVQCGMMTAITRPIEDKRRFMREMSIGGASDRSQVHNSTSQGIAREDQEAGRLCAIEDTQLDDAEESDSDNEMTSASSQASFATADTSPTATPTTHRDTGHQRNKPTQHINKISPPALRPQDCPPSTYQVASEPNRSLPSSANHPHDIVAFDEELILIARRHITWIEQQWHPSKSRGIHRFNGLKKRDLVRLSPGFQPSGTVGATLYGDLVRVGRWREHGQQENTQ